jgi:trigger factor
MKSEIKKLPASQMEITIELSLEEFQPYLDQAVKTISAEVKIPGFRPGKAGYETIKQKVGENTIWQEALEPAVKKTLIQVLDEN